MRYTAVKVNEAAVGNIDDLFWYKRYRQDRAIETSGKQPIDTVTETFSSIFSENVPNIEYKDMMLKADFSKHSRISSFLLEIGDGLKEFYDSLSDNASFKGKKGTLFCREFNILVRNLTQNSDVVFQASETDKQEQIDLQSYREPPLAMPPVNGENRPYNPDERFGWTHDDPVPWGSRSMNQAAAIRPQDP